MCTYALGLFRIKHQQQAQNLNKYVRLFHGSSLQQNIVMYSTLHLIIVVVHLMYIKEKAFSYKILNGNVQPFVRYSLSIYFPFEPHPLIK